MRSRAGGLGFAVVLVALAIVLILAARAWRAAAPTVETLAPAASALGEPAASSQAGEAGEAGTSEELGAPPPPAGALPDTRAMQANTEKHAEELERALAEVP